MSPTFSKVSATFGAEVTEVDLRKPLSASETTAISEALVKYKVLFFRNQELTPEQHIEFSANFGPVLDVHPWSPRREGFSKIMLLRNGAASGWHSDETWRAETPLGSILYCREAPAYGGDTCFADMEKSYDDLSDELKAEVEGLVAVHDHLVHRRNWRRRGTPESQIERWKIEYPEVEHPIARPHPVSGRKSLFVNSTFTARIKGMEQEKSKNLLRRLYRAVEDPHRQIRFKWETNSMAFWDNRSIQHYGVNDFDNQQRHMERTTIAEPNAA